MTLAQQGDISGANSIVQTTYAAAGVAPLGMKSQVSEPYVGSPSSWTVYVYDGLGRATSATLADTHSQTTYAYTGATTKSTDPAGSGKQVTLNAFGDTLTVTEPNPVTPGQTYVTNHTYDPLDHLIQVSMTRPTSTGPYNRAYPRVICRNTRNKFPPMIFPTRSSEYPRRYIAAVKRGRSLISRIGSGRVGPPSKSVPRIT